MVVVAVILSFLFITSLILGALLSYPEFSFIAFGFIALVILMKEMSRSQERKLYQLHMEKREAERRIRKRSIHVQMDNKVISLDQTYDRTLVEVPFLNLKYKREAARDE